MTDKEVIKHLYNFYTVALATHTPVGLVLPLSYVNEHRYDKHTVNYVGWNSVLKLNDNTDAVARNAVVGIYDSKNNMVWCNVVKQQADNSKKVYTVGDIKVNQYGTSTTIARPGVYYSQVIFSGYNCLPAKPVVTFTVKEGVGDGSIVFMINHEFHTDTTNVNGIWYIENAIPEKIDMIKYAPKE